MLDKYPNLHADIGARYSELSPIPRFVSQFFQRYQGRLLRRLSRLEGLAPFSDRLNKVVFV